MEKEIYKERILYELPIGTRFKFNGKHYKFLGTIKSTGAASVFNMYQLKREKLTPDIYVQVKVKL